MRLEKASVYAASRVSQLPIQVMNERRLTYEWYFNIGILYVGCYGRNLFCWRACRFIWRKGAVIMDGIGNLISMLDYVLDTKRKRHITGGILLSVSLLFGGMALTVMTIKNEEDEEIE